MKLVKIERSGATAQGVLVGDNVQLIGPWSQSLADKTAFTLGGKSIETLKALLSASTEFVPLESVHLATPIDPFAQILCAGFNYHAHLAEIAADLPTHPVIFKRTIETLVPHGAPIVRPLASETLDYEGEIAVTIGRSGRHILEADAMTYVSGYCCFMDGSVREYQKHSVTAGKNFWRTGAMGPWIVTPDEIQSDDMKLETFVDGELRQSSTVSRMIFNIPQLIAYCSIMTCLQPGDVIATGTPGGVGSRMTPPSWLRTGQRVKVAIENVGSLENTVTDEAAA